METRDRENFGKLLMAIGELYNKQVSASLVKIYWRVLETFVWEDVVNAFQAHVQDPDSGQFLPKPADIIRVIKGNSHSQGLQAWTKVDQAIRCVGPYQSVVFDDAIIHAVLQEMGGWIRICSVGEDELPFVAKEFQTRFNAYRYKAPQGYPRYLVGINEHQNRLNGGEVQPPRLLGDQTKAQAILSHGKQEAITQAVINLLPGECYA